MGGQKVVSSQMEFWRGDRMKMLDFQDPARPNFTLQIDLLPGEVNEA